MRDSRPAETGDHIEHTVGQHSPIEVVLLRGLCGFEVCCRLVAGLLSSCCRFAACYRLIAGLLLPLRGCRLVAASWLGFLKSVVSAVNRRQHIAHGVSRGSFDFPNTKLRRSGSNLWVAVRVGALIFERNSLFRLAKI